MPETELTVEQMCRNLLTQAIRDGLVAMREWPPATQHWTSGELVGMANLLSEYLRRERDERE